jgi:serine protease Do
MNAETHIRQDAHRYQEVEMTFKRMIYLFVLLVVAGAAALSGGVLGGLVVYQAVRQSKSTTPVVASQSVGAVPAKASNTSQVITVNTTEIETTITKAVQDIGPAVVTVVGTIPGQQTFWGQTGDQTVSGSGFFISQDGYVLTNNHVVDGTTKVSIVLSDGTQEDATIVGTDQYADVAVLKVAGQVPAVATLGNSDVLNPGESLIAIGSPLGDFKNTVTVGVLSATGRSIDTGQGYIIEGLLQTDAAINEGNSGGPLVNLAGQVIGINTLVVRGTGTGTVAEGLGFAIPINTAQAVAQQILEKGYVPHPYLGIQWQAITPGIAARYRLPASWGVYITDVAANSPASKVDLRQGDIITGIDDVSLDDTHSYLNTLFLHQPGDQVTLTVVRGSKTMKIQVTLGESNSG